MDNVEGDIAQTLLADFELEYMMPL